MWFNHTLDDENVAPFSLMVWANDGMCADGSEGPGTVLYELTAQQPEFAEDYLDFVTYYLEEPLPISGTFYVGFYQVHDVQLNIGFDQNNDARGKFFYRTSAQWYPSFYKGAPMIRPVVGKSFDHSGVPQHAQSNVRIYPNPTTGIIHIQTDEYEQDMQYKVMNVYGQCVESGTLYSNELSLERYPSGLYFIQLLSGNQIVVNEKIIKH